MGAEDEADEEGGEEEEDEDDSPQGIIKKMDKDGDGKLTMEEILSNPEAEPEEEEKAKLEQFFKNADTDGDGKLDEHQLEALIKPSKRKRTYECKRIVL